MDEATQWVKGDPDGLAERQVMTVVTGGRPICLTRTAGGYGALDNRCPHQGGSSWVPSDPCGRRIS